MLWFFNLFPDLKLVFLAFSSLIFLRRRRSKLGRASG